MTAPLASRAGQQAVQPDATGVRPNTLGDGHAHRWERNGTHAWQCDLCGSWTHQEPLGCRVVAEDWT